MQVIVKARHMDLTRGLRRHAEEKLGNAIMRVFDRPAARVEIELNENGEHRDGQNQECRVSVFVPKGRPIVITEIDENMHKAIDLCHDRLLVQVKRARERRNNTHRARVAAKNERRQTARMGLTHQPEPWELELEEYEESLMH